MNTQKFSFLNKKKPLLFKEAGVRPGPWLGLARFVWGSLAWLASVPSYFFQNLPDNLKNYSGYIIANMSYNVKH
ncbi:MAG: hypothetical protein A3A90_00920 [Candidatus Zambryskibacteria bacterium RIFCSPLOWO2_01_FULL_35_19]|uniref:Uncharacterized protein n=1 Tax=Candidatus Zambryskibacteria bacterium RIFCSPLOWO2_01_FULL_35_19 TaxID=1802757 RepID=A0A1G2TYV0_9BACT|nr:MAG: hypothetical protein A2726_00055 [Candidatus Zambryskibacteria bacterium RIFCSPHIGHO2_01_FULL_35_32]OHB02343.1 MAG: hypothetical protein A3A90_00920 [Candidatus Zambryskibacteria bacterium RIFCSPLOWO2_01_FULL_35_19]